MFYIQYLNKKKEVYEIHLLPNIIVLTEIAIITLTLTKLNDYILLYRIRQTMGNNVE